MTEYAQWDSGLHEADVFQKEFVTTRVIDVDSDFHPIPSFIRGVPELVEEARRGAREKADSYRHFLVGAAGYFYDAENHRVGIISAGNFKANIPEAEREPTDIEKIPKVCAEMAIIIEANHLEFTTMIGAVVAATSNKRLIREVTGHETSTLHPCDECREVGRKDTMVCDDSLIATVSINTSAPVYQVQTFSELLDRYDPRAPQFRDAESLTYDPSDWDERAGWYEFRARNNGLLLPDVLENGAIDRRKMSIARLAMTSF